MSESGTPTNNSQPKRGGLWRIAAWGAAAALLLTPLVAMQFSNEVVWTGLDFAVLGAMLAAALGAFEIALRLNGHIAYRAGAVVAIATGFMLVWINIAVGMIGTEGDPANLVYAGVLVVAITGVCIARFRAGGVARAMTVAALAQVAASVVALLVDGYATFVLSGAFTLPWLLSAWLFATAARAESRL